uniref:Uncharacterized protein n=1 Tax=Lynx canadensis TaxID=61383 RepID=A0A667HIP3_LYNCA
TASPGLRRWLGSARLLRAGRPPGQRVGGPPGAPPAELGPLRGRQARDGRVLLSEQTVHLGRSRGGVTAPGAPQPVRLPASRLVSSHRVPLSVTHAHEESQGEGQEAPAGVPQGAPGAAVGGRGPHGSRGDWRAVTRTADLSRIYALPPRSGTNSRLGDPGCGLEGLKEARRGIKNGVTRDWPGGTAVRPLRFPPRPLGAPAAGSASLRRGRDRAGQSTELASPSARQDA